MAVQQTLSQATLNEAHRMALQSHTWSQGTSKRDGRKFYVIPSRSDAGKAHYTTSYGCTCIGFWKHGDCAHAESVRMVEARERATAPTTYDRLFPAEDDGRLTSVF